MDRIESRILAFMALMAAGAGSAAAQGVQAPIRNQTPDQPLPYPTAEVVVEAGAELSCTISLPKGVGDGAAPGAVLLTVAGANDRDQTHSGHRPYLVLADHLARNGIASIRCDDRGVGGSTGSLSDASMEDLRDDALAMHARLSSESGIGAVGFIGNSEGSVVGAMAASEAGEEAAFVILLGGVGVG